MTLNSGEARPECPKRWKQNKERKHAKINSFLCFFFLKYFQKDSRSEKEASRILKYLAQIEKI